MGKVDPQHIDLQVDPLNILRPLSKLIHQLPLVICFFMHHLLNNSYREIGFALVVKPLLSIHRSVRIHPSQGWELVLVWSSKEGEWTPQQMNRCLQIAPEILLVPWITYFTLVSFTIASLNDTFMPVFIFDQLHMKFYGFWFQRTL